MPVSADDFRASSTGQTPATPGGVSADDFRTGAPEQPITPLSYWNNFWRQADLFRADIGRGIVSGLTDFYENMTGTGHFSDRTPEQLRSSIDGANYHLQDLHSQLDALTREAQGGPPSGAQTLQSQIASVNADILGMQHQLALKTGAAKPTVLDDFGNAMKEINKQATDRADEERGLKDPTPTNSPLLALSRGLGNLPVVGPVLGEAPGPTPAEQRDPITQLSGAFGQLAGGLPLFGGGLGAEMFGFAMQRGQNARDEARAAGLDEIGQSRAASLGMITGAAEAPFYRFVFGRLVGDARPVTVGDLVAKLTKNVAAGAGLGAEQVAASNMIAVASGIDPNRKLTDGMTQSILSQAGMFGLAGGIVDTPSFLLKSIQKPKLDTYLMPGQGKPEEQLVDRLVPPALKPTDTTTAAVTPKDPTAPARTTPVTAEELEGRLQAAGIPYTTLPSHEETAARANEIYQRRLASGEQGDERTDWEQAEQELLRERASSAAVAKQLDLSRVDLSHPQTQAAVPPSQQQPPTRSAIADMLEGLRTRLGPAFGFRVMTPDQLPNRYKLELANQGIAPGQYSAFYDKGFGTFFINPNGFDNLAQLQDAIIRKYVVNSLADRANIHPIMSYSDVQDSPAIAQMVQQFPNSDRDTLGIYDRSSGNVYLNMPRILGSADPVHQAMTTAVHEIAGHQGIGTLFKGNTNDYNAFLDRVYAGMVNSGAGDRIAARFGMNMGQLADSYKLDLNTDAGRRMIAEELLARYSERFNPEELGRAPSVIAQAIDHIQNGLFNGRGLRFSEADALNTLKSAWRHTDPALAAKTAAAAAGVAQKRIGEYGEVTSNPQVDAEDTYITNAAIGRAARGNIANETARGTPSRFDGLARSGTRVLKSETGQDDWITSPFLDPIKGDELHRGNNAEHDVWVTPDGGHVLKQTKPDGRSGPYGLFPALPQPASIDSKEYYYGTPWSGANFSYTAASIAQYLQSLQIRNRFFPESRGHFEGYTAHPGDSVPRIVTTAPFADPGVYRDSTEGERNRILNEHGFQPIDNATYYNPAQKVIAIDLHDGNLLVSNEDPKDFRVIDGTFAQATGKLADHFQSLLEQNVYEQRQIEQFEQFRGQQQQLEREAIGAATESEYQADMQWMPRTSELEPISASEYARREQEASLNLAKARQDMMRDREIPRERKTPEETDLDNLMNLLGRKKEEALPQEVIDQIKKTLAVQKPTEGVRMGAAKAVINPDAPLAVRVAGAMPDQLLYDKVSAPIWDAKANEVWTEHLGDNEKVMADFLDGKIDGKRGVDVAATVWAKLSQEFDYQRSQTNDPTEIARINNAQIAVNKKFFELGTKAGQGLSAFNNAWYGAEGLLAKYHGALAKMQQDYMVRDIKFKDAVRRFRSLLGDVNNDVSDRLKDLFLKADQANDKTSALPVPIQYVNDVSKKIIEQARRAGLPPDKLPALQELFSRFQGTITQLAKENGLPMDRPARARMSASDRIAEGINNWDWMTRTLNQTVADAQAAFADEADDKPEVLAYKQRMRDAFTELGKQYSVPFTDTQLAKFVGEKNVKIGDLVRQHRSSISATMDDLADYLTKNSNLSPEQSQAVADAVASHVGAAVDVRRQAEFQRIIEESAGKKLDPDGAKVSMQRFLDLINMGAFDDSAVADALAPAFGYKSYDPKFAAQLRDLGDKLEAYKRQGREGIQTEQIKLQMLDAMNQWRTSTYGWLQRNLGVGRNIFLGNILTGVPTHVVAATNDFLEGMGSINGFMARLPSNEARIAAIPKVVARMWDGFIGPGGGWDRFRHIMQTGVDPNQQTSIRDIMQGFKEPGYLPQRADIEMTGWLKPYNYIFRAVTALHALMRNGMEEPIEWLYTFDQLARDPNMSMEQALDQADELMNGNAAFRQDAEQKARAEGLTGREYRIRVQEQIDKNRMPITRDIGALFGSRTVFTQPPEGLLGAGARALQGMLREVPSMRYIVPFTNIVSNVLNAGINWTPWGFVRSIEPVARSYFKETFRRAPDADIGNAELNLLRQDLIAKATMGTTGIFALWAMSKIPGPGGQPLFTIHGAGPPDPQKKFELMDRGWMPNSIEFNLPGMPKPYYVPYEATPISIGLSLIGNTEDAIRYGTGDALQRATYIISHTGAAITDRSFLRGIKDVLDASSGSENEAQGSAALMRLVQNWTASQIPYLGSAMTTQIYHQLADPKVYARGTGVPILADVLRQVPFANWIDGSKPKLNVLGEPITSYPYRRMAGQLASQDPVWRFLDQHDIFLSDPNAPKIQGQTMKPEERYLFTQQRGKYLKEMLSDNLDGLSDENLDPEIRQKMVDHFSQLATERAKADVLEQRP